MDQWLARNASNFISGPYTRQEVIALIESRKLGLDDEVCPGNGYWIFLHEHQELQKQLGVTVPRYDRKKDAEEEVTETQTEVLTESARAKGEQPHGPRVIPVVPVDGATVHPEGPVVRPYVPSPRPVVSVMNGDQTIERPMIYRALVWVLLLVLVAGVYAVLKLLA